MQTHNSQNDGDLPHTSELFGLFKGGPTLNEIRGIDDAELLREISNLKRRVGFLEGVLEALPMVETDSIHNVIRNVTKRYEAYKQQPASH